MTSTWQLTRDMFLSFDEVDLLLDHVRAPCRNASTRRRVAACLDRLMIEGLLFSGLRTSEFCGLTVANTIVGRGESVFVIEGLKGRDRTVHVPSEVSRLVEQFVADIRPGLLPADVDPNDPTRPLVYGERKNPLERTGLYRRVVRVLRAAGLGDRASVQLLRHTYGYLAYALSHGNLLFVQRQLGHAHPMVTAIYAQFVEESYQPLAEQIFIGSAITHHAGGA
ncbi:MAG TPA: hypothetical protein DD670_20215 [Planctomycetaceae bacterium]|nr:hypothetical protein [Planctomycetaceae bacterium]